MNTFVGTWVANLEKSRRHANHQFQSATLTFAVSDDEVTITHAGVNMAGKPESGKTVLQADGVERPASPQAPGVVLAAKWIGTRVLSTQASKDGQSVGGGSYEVSEDG